MIFCWIHLFAGTSELLCWDYQIILLESVSSIARRRQPLFFLARDVPGGATKLAKLEPAHNFAGIGSQFCWNRLRQEQRTNEDVATCGLFCWNRRRVLLHGGRTHAHERCNHRAGEGARRAATASGAMELEAGGHGGDDEQLSKQGICATGVAREKRGTCARQSCGPGRAYRAAARLGRSTGA